MYALPNHSLTFVSKSLFLGSDNARHAAFPDALPPCPTPLSQLPTNRGGRDLIGPKKDNLENSSINRNLIRARPRFNPLKASGISISSASSRTIATLNPSSILTLKAREL